MGLGRPQRLRHSRLTVGPLLSHMQLDILVPEHRGPLLAADIVVGDVTGQDREAALANHLVAARVVRMHVGIDDETDRLVARELFDLHQQFLGERLEAGVHDQHAFISHLYRDIGRLPGQQPYVALHVPRHDLDVAEIPHGGWRAIRPSRGADQDQQAHRAAHYRKSAQAPQRHSCLNNDLVHLRLRSAE